MSTYDVRVWGILRNKTAKGATYTVRWTVAGKARRETFATRALAESFRSRLVVAQREGVAFDEASGLPEPMARERNTRSWYEHAMAARVRQAPQEHRRSADDRHSSAACHRSRRAGRCDDPGGTLRVGVQQD